MRGAEKQMHATMSVAKETADLRRQWLFPMQRRRRNRPPHASRPPSRREQAREQSHQQQRELGSMQCQLVLVIANVRVTHHVQGLQLERAIDQQGLGGGLGCSQEALVKHAEDREALAGLLWGLPR
jgi:hypothetical protein